MSQACRLVISTLYHYTNETHLPTAPHHFRSGPLLPAHLKTKQCIPPSLLTSRCSPSILAPPLATASPQFCMRRGRMSWYVSGADVTTVARYEVTPCYT